MRRRTRRRARRAIRRLLFPTAASVGLHVALLVVVATVTWTVAVGPPPSPPPAEINITLDDPRAEPEDPDGPEPDEPPITTTPARGQTPQQVSPVPAVDPSQRASRDDAAGAPGPVATSLPRRAEGRASGAPASPTRRGAAFAGVRADRALDVVYVLDASGAMAPTLPFAIEELTRSIARLGPSQSFQIVVFRDASLAGGEGREATEVFRPRGGDAAPELVRATPAARAAAEAWLETIRPLGRSNPLDGLERALAFEADAVFLLTRSIPRTGYDAGDGARAETRRREVLQRLDRLNPRDGRNGARPTVIRTIQFVDDDPTGLLQAIAREHAGGRDGYSVRTVEDLLRRREGGEPDPSDEAEARWARAAEALGRLSDDGADVAALLGLPLEEQVDRVRREARTALNALGPAEETDVLPLLRARSLLLLAATERDGETRREHLEQARRTLVDAEPVMRRLPENEAYRRLGLALVEILGDPDGVDERVATHLDRAQTLLPTEDEAREHAPLLAELAMARVYTLRGFEARREAAGRLFEVVERAPLAGEDGPDPVLTLLVRDVATRAMWAVAESPEAQREALAPMVEQLDHPALADLDWPDRVDLIASRLGVLLPEGIDGDGLPPIAAYALAVRLERYDPEGAAARFEAVAAREDAGRVRGEALLRRASLLLARSDERLDALRRAAASLRGESRSRDALHTALHEADQRSGPIPLDLLEEALDSDPPLEDRAYWMSRRDRKLVELAGETLTPSGGLTDETLRLLERIEAGSAEADRVAEVLRRGLEGWGSWGAWPAVTRGAEDAELARRTAAILERHGAQSAAEDAMLRHADLLVRHGAYDDAAVVYRGLIERGADVPGGLDRVRVSLAGALHAQGRDREAFGLVRPLAERLNELPEAEEDVAVFWETWTLSLEILLANDGGSSARARARAHLARLRGIDATLGGEPWATRLERLETGQ